MKTPVQDMKKAGVVSWVDWKKSSGKHTYYFKLDCRKLPGPWCSLRRVVVPFFDYPTAIRQRIRLFPLSEN